MSALPAIHPNPAEQRRVLLFSLLGTVFDGADFAVFIFFLAPLAARFRVTLVAMEGIQAASYLAGIGGAILFGLLADRFGRRLGLTLTVVVYSLGTLASAFAPSYTALFVWRIVAGTGIGGEAGLAIAYLNEAWHPRRRGVATAWLQSMFLVGSAIATVLFTSTTARFGADAWRWAFGLLGVAVLLAGALRLWMPESRAWLARQARPRGQAASGSAGALRAPGLLRLTLRLAALMTGTFFAAYAVETYAPSALLTVYRLSAASVGDFAFLGLTVIFAAYLCFGGLSDRWGRRPTLVAAASVGGFGFILYAWLLASGADLGVHPGRLPAHTLVALLWMLAAAAPLGVQGTWAAELFPTEVRATAVNAAYYVGRGLGGGLAPLAALALVQHLGGGLRLTMTVGLLGLVMALPLAMQLPETRGAPLLLTTNDSGPRKVDRGAGSL